MQVFAKTDVGKARENNQDYYYISDDNEIPGIYILADGMGGYNGGEIASKMAVEAVSGYIKSNFEKMLETVEERKKTEINKNIEKEEILKLLKSGIQYANMVVFEESKRNAELEGMGTTLDICLIYNNKVYIGHIGDSRVYRIRNNVMRKLTKDHSYVQQLIEDKKITREEAMHHPKKNMITKALGCTPYIEPDLRARAINKNDCILMCSDGLTNMVSEEEIYKITKENPSDAVNKLVMLANENGGYDNITVLIIIHL
jgi:protein phosphatase